MASIREQIIRSIVIALRQVSITNGFNCDIKMIERGRVAFDDSELSAISVLPGIEVSSRRAGERINTMEVTLRYFKILANTWNPSEIAEKVLADMIIGILGVRLSCGFNNGSSEIVPGVTIIGDSSGASGKVLSVTLTGGSWVGGNATGTLVIYYPLSLPFSLGEDLMVAGMARANLSTALNKIDLYTTSVGDVQYLSGGVENYPGTGERILEVVSKFNFVYSTINDNPYL